MCKLLLEKYADSYDFKFVFANTGQEHELTLEFVNQCDKAFGLQLTWVEAVVFSGERKGTSFKVVDFITASRCASILGPFEQVIQKYGLPNMSYPRCTRELKLQPMYAFIASTGWVKGDFKVAIGIRADEPKRIRSDAESVGIVYPLAHWDGVDKQDVNTWWEHESFDLQIPDRLGNCTWCYKKSDAKHFANLVSDPQFYKFPQQMEEQYPSERRIFRSRRSTSELVALSKHTFGGLSQRQVDPDENSGCSEGCEAFGDTT